MVFSTYTFIFGFLPVVFGGYRLLVWQKRHNVAKLWLVLASLYFYAAGSPDYLLLFVLSVFGNYAVGTLILRVSGRYARLQKRLLFAGGLALNLSSLGYFKYTNFLIENANAVFDLSLPLQSIFLPLGISFYTFQLIAYLVDCYRGEIEQHPVLDYLLFITFFPQLIVGPIVHHHDVIPQFHDNRQVFFHKENFMLAIFVFAIGCAKKIVLADPLTAYAEAFLQNVDGADVFTTWLSVLSYTFSYYFDLSGYADMAIGLGLFFNIRLPENFRSPYKARNFRDYWQRWHITLSRFLSDYVFRSAYWKGRGSFNFYFAVMVTFFVSGFWHGAGWKFVLWGVVNGVLVCAAHAMERNGLRFPYPLAWFLTFLGIVGTRILFVSDSTAQALQVVRKLFDFGGLAHLGYAEVWRQTATFLAFNLTTVVTLAVGMAIAFGARSTSEMTADFKPRPRHAVWAAFLLVFSLFQMTSVSDFLYFQF